MPQTTKLAIAISELEPLFKATYEAIHDGRMPENVPK